MPNLAPLATAFYAIQRLRRACRPADCAGLNETRLRWSGREETQFRVGPTLAQVLGAAGELWQGDARRPAGIIIWHPRSPFSFSQAASRARHARQRRPRCRCRLRQYSRSIHQRPRRAALALCCRLPLPHPHPHPHLHPHPSCRPGTPAGEFGFLRFRCRPSAKAQTHRRSPARPNLPLVPNQTRRQRGGRLGWLPRTG